MRKIRSMHYLVLISLISLFLLVSCRSDTKSAQILKTVTLQVVMPPGFDDLSLFDDFLEQNPSVEIALVDDSRVNPYYPTTLTTSLSRHLNDAREQASLADVIYVTSTRLSVESTRAGFYQNLGPLISGDATLSTDPFHPTMTTAFSWDEGIWALPFASSNIILAYRADLLAEVGVQPPSELWTIDEFRHAMTRLSTATRPGLLASSYENFILRSLVGQPLYDDNYNPRINTSETIQALDVWKGLLDEGAIDYGGGFFSEDYAMEDVPIIAMPAIALSENNPNNRAVALLPGSTLGMELGGFAVSAGSSNPELAYKLVSYLTTLPQLLEYVTHDTPARQSLIETTEPYPEIDYMLIRQGLEHGLSPSQALFSDYLSVALGRISDEENNIESILSDVEDEIETMLSAAADQAVDTTFTVDTSRLLVRATSVPGRVTLNFGGLGLIETTHIARNVIDAFIATDPEVGRINLIEPETLEEIDCFFLPSNFVGAYPPGSLVDLQPLMSADPNFDVERLANDVISQLTIDGGVYGYPFVLYPYLIILKETQFFNVQAAGFTEFEVDITTFLNFIQNGTQPNPVLSPDFGSGNTPFLMLTAAVGSLPYDYRSNPPTLNLNDPTVVQNVQQILDLAKNNIILYEGLEKRNTSSIGQPPPPFRSMDIATMDALSFNGRVSANDVQMLSFPSGSRFAPVSYEIGAGYISASSLHPEACYRWLSFIADKPYLFNGIPADLTLVDDPSLVASQSNEIIQFYKEYVEVLQSENAIYFPPISDFPINLSTFIEGIWLNQVFDAYVIDGADLTSEMNDLRNDIEVFRSCVANIDVESQYSQGYRDAVIDCGVGVSPELAGRLEVGG